MGEIATAVELDGQYRALREEAGFLVRNRAMLLVEGPDAAEYLQGQLTNDTEALAPGQGCYAALLDRKGHLQSDMRVLRLESDGSIWLDLEPGPDPAVLKHLRTYSIGRDVEIDDVGERWALYSVIGPRAGELSGFDDLRPEHAQRFRDWDDIEVLGVATDLGVDLIVRREQTGALEELLRGAGIPEVSEKAAEIVRIESGPSPLRGGHGAGVDARRGRHRRAGGGLREGLLHRPGAGGAAPLSRQAEPDPAGPAAERRRRAGPAAHARRAGDRRPGQQLPLPALGPIALGIVRKEAGSGDVLAVGEGDVTAEVVDLPFHE